jgi:DNA-binding HxlR family transcriptional regulator
MLSTTQPISVYDVTCPARQALEQIADKWSMLTIHLLSQREYRFSELLKSIQGISQKMLTETLRKQERAGIVRREVNPTTVPISVTYSLTKLGEALVRPIDAIRCWAEEHLEEVLTAQTRYDAAKNLNK